MTLSALIKKGGLREVATAIPATAATDDQVNPRTVARIATVAVANPQSPEIGDREKAHRMAFGEAAPVTAQVQAATRPAGLTAQAIIDIDAGKISAVLIDSDFGPLWFAFDDDFQPGDSYPVFFASELPFLRKMTPDELRRRYAEKRALGGWIRDRIDEPTKH